MVIEDSDGGGDDVAGTTGRASRVVRRADDVALGVGTVEGAVGAGGMISAGISAYCAYCGCLSCGISGGAGLVGASGSAT